MEDYLKEIEDLVDSIAAEVGYEYETFSLHHLIFNIYYYKNYRAGRCYKIEFFLDR